MALVDKWVNKVDGVDDVLADDINAIADEVIQTQKDVLAKIDKTYVDTAIQTAILDSWEVSV